MHCLVCEMYNPAGEQQYDSMLPVALLQPPSSIRMLGHDVHESDCSSSK